VSSSLSSVPVERRRHAAAVAGLLATLLAAMGVLPWVGDAPGAVRVFSIVALVAAVVVALVAWGLLASAATDRAETRLDAAIASAVAEAGGACDCGHEHDPDEMHITDAASCPSGGTCTHSCDTCVLAARRE
jgi:multisubunit Na+/H+ antiporter MnhG subunit